VSEACEAASGSKFDRSAPPPARKGSPCVPTPHEMPRTALSFAFYRRHPRSFALLLQTVGRAFPSPGALPVLVNHSKTDSRHSPAALPHCGPSSLPPHRPSDQPARAGSSSLISRLGREAEAARGRGSVQLSALAEDHARGGRGRALPIMAAAAAVALGGARSRRRRRRRRRPRQSLGSTWSVIAAALAAALGAACAASAAAASGLWCRPRALVRPLVSCQGAHACLPCPPKHASVASSSGHDFMTPPIETTRRGLMAGSLALMIALLGTTRACRRPIMVHHCCCWHRAVELRKPIDRPIEKMNGTLSHGLQTAVSSFFVAVRTEPMELRGGSSRLKLNTRARRGCRY
jgi:hypothetical protein